MQAYGDAMGLHGDEGRARAEEAFRAAPGYQFALDSGLDAIDRRAASRGMLGSGNTNLDTIQFAQGLADQQWQSYLGGLQPYMGVSQGAASGISQTNQNLGTVQYGYGRDLADLGLKEGEATAQALADAHAAKQTSSGNMWNAVMGVGKLVGGLISDERAKEGGEVVGELFDGQPVYRFQYKGDPTVRIGLMAGDVEQSVPDAVFVASEDGVRGVDYGRATERAASLARRLMEA